VSENYGSCPRLRYSSVNVRERERGREGGREGGNLKMILVHPGN